MSSDPVTLVLSIGSIIISVLGALRCIKSINSCCCQVQIQDIENQNQPNPPKLSFADIVKAKFTPRKLQPPTPKPQPQPPTDSANMSL